MTDGDKALRIRWEAGVAGAPRDARTREATCTPMPAPSCSLGEGGAELLEAYLLLVDEVNGNSHTVDPKFLEDVDRLSEAPIGDRITAAALALNAGHIHELSWDQMQDLTEFGGSEDTDSQLVPVEAEDMSAWWEEGFKIVARGTHNEPIEWIHSRHLEPSQVGSMLSEQRVDDNIAALAERFEEVKLDSVQQMMELQRVLSECTYSINLLCFTADEMQAIWRELGTSSSLRIVFSSGNAALQLRGPNAGALFDLLDGDESTWQYGSRHIGSPSRVARAVMILFPKGRDRVRTECEYGCSVPRAYTEVVPDEDRLDENGEPRKKVVQTAKYCEHGFSDPGRMQVRHVEPSPARAGVKHPRSQSRFTGAKLAEFCLWLDFKFYVEERESSGFEFVGVDTAGVPRFSRVSKQQTAYRVIQTREEGEKWIPHLKRFS